MADNQSISFIRLATIDQPNSLPYYKSRVRLWWRHILARKYGQGRSRVRRQRRKCAAFPCPVVLKIVIPPAWLGVVQGILGGLGLPVAGLPALPLYRPPPTHPLHPLGHGPCLHLSTRPVSRARTQTILWEEIIHFGIVQQETQAGAILTHTLCVYR